MTGLKVWAKGNRVGIDTFDRRLGDVARQIERHSDGRSIIIIDRAARRQLRESGNNLITVRNAQWEEVSVSVQYLADFLSSMGCSHNTNPYALRCSLTSSEIVAVLIATLRDSCRNQERRGNRSQATTA